VRIYTASSEEALRARKFLKDWVSENLITKAQYERLEQETVSDLRTTNIFLRLVLFLFTLIGVGAAVGLFFTVFLRPGPDRTLGVFLLMVSGVCYVGAEAAVSRARLYRYGIEEALAACSVAFLCAGIELVFFSGYPYLPNRIECVVPAAGTVFSLWIWHRFGLWYVFLAAMIFAIFLPGYWTSSFSAERGIIALFYAMGLISVIAVRSRHRFGYVEDDYSVAEALLWLGMYLAINLKLLSFDPLEQQWVIGTAASSEFSRPFYWTTWVLIWCLPPVVLARGIRRKDRFVIAVGAITAILTLVTNKPYLGWPRHTWDPMILGILLTGVALFIRRWLARGAGGIRHGFTAARVSGKDKRWMSAGSAVLGLVAPQAVTPSPQTSGSEFRFGGGATGGGGAGGDY